MTTLPAFPVARPGETFASVVARALARSCAPKIRQLELLGLRHATASSVIPRDLQRFVSVMPIGHPWAYSPDLIAHRHTLLPLILYFANPSRAKTAVEDIIAGKSENPAASLGITVAMSIGYQHGGRFCPDCVAHDLETLGYPVLYRQHQPPFVTVCATHGRPLHSNCLRCRSQPRGAAMWRMAATCECMQPHTPPVLEGLDTRTEESWLWLSRQVVNILEAQDPFPVASVLANLYTALQSTGFVAVRGGLDSTAMVEALLDRFGEPFLKQLGVESWCAPAAHRQRPSRLLTRSAIDGRRIPNVLLLLLISRLVTDNVTLLSTFEPCAHQSIDRQPAGYGRRTHGDRAPIERAAIISALDAAEGKITIAAQRLGVSSAVLAADMRRHHLRLPMSEATATRLGDERIAAVRKALTEGVPKNQIAVSYGISEWSLLLIELDQPELGDAHREATVVRQRNIHRDALLSFLRRCPGKPRDEFRARHPGSHDWLRKYDRHWLDANLPDIIRGRKASRKVRKGGAQLDRAAISAIRRTVSQELAKSDRPIRLTKTRLLSAGASAANSSRLSQRHPKATAEAARLAETKDQFLRRTIRWALYKYAGMHTAISMNMLRRVARLTAGELKNCRSYVIEVAAELALPFDARCALAPWHEEP